MLRSLRTSSRRKGSWHSEEAEQWVTLNARCLQVVRHTRRRASRARCVDTVTRRRRGAARQAADCAPYASFEPVAEQRYRLLETCALIRFGHLAQVRLVRSVIGHLATDDHLSPTIVIDINAKMLDNGHLRSDVYRDGIAVGRAPRLSEVAPIVKAALWQSAINAHDFLFYIPCRRSGNRCRAASSCPPLRGAANPRLPRPSSTAGSGTFPTKWP